MQINLSDKTINTVCRALRSNKNILESRLRQVEIGRAAKEKEDDFKKKLEEVKYALSIFEDLSQ